MDKTRVRIVCSSHKSDYINANYVKMFDNSYIATQAPLPQTFNDFWTMIWEQNVEVIVMLTRLIESGKYKADKYWPTKCSKTYANLKVTLLDIKKNEFDYRIKEFEIKFGDETRKLFQFQFLAWPDHGVPYSPNSLIHMMASINQISYKGPILVHCSAGIGRTGTFIIIHSCLKKLTNEAKIVNDINLKDAVLNLRSQRHGCITRESQYLFCYSAIDLGLTSGLFRQKKNQTLSTKKSCLNMSCYDIQR